MAVEDSKILFSEELQDILRVSGIKAKGYGILPKFVMLDRDLSLDAKAIYAYLCSLTGTGDTVFPSRDLILSHLHIGKNAYYGHFNQLKEQGYITVGQERSKGSQFAHNVYTIVSNPKKFENHVEGSDSKVYSKIRMAGLEAAGYGMIPRVVMIDPRLECRAKAIYAYFCVFTGSGNNAFPKQKNLLYHLNISQPTYYKFYNRLQELNYIQVQQRTTESGKFSVNDYYLIQNPDIEKVSEKPIARNRDTEQIADITPFSPIAKNSDTANSSPIARNRDTEMRDTEQRDTEIKDTITTSVTKNKEDYYYQSIHQQAAAPQKPASPGDRWIDVIEDYRLLNEVFGILYENGLPYHFKDDERYLLAAIYTLTDYETFKDNGWADEYKQSVYQMAVDCLIDLCSFDGYKTFHGQRIHYARVIDKVNACISRDSDIEGESFTKYVTVFPVLEAAMDDYSAALKERDIKNPFGYMQACIWRAFSTHKERVHNMLARDGYV